MRTITDIARDIATQDNLCTENPLFVVQQKKRIWGLDTNYTEDTIWLSAEDFERVPADEKTAKRLDHYYELSADNECELDGPDGKQKWERVGYRDEWVFVTACLTRAGCEAYLRLNGHNLGETRIFVEGGYRNHELEVLRRHMLRVPHLHEAINAASRAYIAGNQEELGEVVGALMAIVTHCDGAP